MKLSVLSVSLSLLPIIAALFAGGCSAESKRAKSLDRADQHLKAKEFEKARIEYQSVLQGDPDNTVANERLAQIWLDRGSPVRAATFLTKLRTLSPGNLEVRLKLARIILALGGVAEARREAVAILERSDNFPDALVLLSDAVRGPEDLKQAEQILEKWQEKASGSYLIAAAKLKAIRGDAEGARGLYLRAVARDLKSSEPRLAYAGFLSDQNQVTEALEECRKAAEIDPTEGRIRLRYAVLLAQTGATSEAKAYLTEMTRQLPDFLPAWRALVELAIAARDYPQAQAFLQALLAKDAADYEGRLLQTRLWLAQGDTKRAIEDLEKFGREFPGLGIEKHQLALAYLQNNDAAAAAKTLQEVVSRNPDNMEAQLQLAGLQLRAGAPQAAGVAMLGVIERRPAYVPAYPILIDALRALGRLDQAVVALERGIKVAPRTYQLHYLLGVVRNQLQKPGDARQSFETVLTLMPGHEGAMAELIGLDLREKNPSAALERARSLVAKAPQSAAAHFLEARVLVARQEWTQAEQVLGTALERDPNLVAAYGLLAECYRARKNDPATLARVTGMLGKHPENEMAVVVAAQFYESIGKADEARGLYEKHLAQKPNAAEVLNNLSNLYATHLKDLDRALETARRARAAAPASPAIADTLGWLLYQKQAYQEALPLLKESAEKLSQLPEVQYHFGMVNLRLGNAEAARAALKLAVAGTSTYAGEEEAKRELAELEKRSPTKAP